MKITVLRITCLSQSPAKLVTVMHALYKDIIEKFRILEYEVSCEINSSNN